MAEEMVYKELREDFNGRLSDIIKEELKNKGIPQQRICDKLQQEYGVELNSGNLSKYFERGGSDFPPLVLAIIAEILDVSLDQLFRKVMKSTDSKRDTITDGIDAKTASASSAIMHIPVPASEMLITDPTHPAFRGYLGTYYTYFTPTYSGGKGVLTGVLTLEERDEKTHARFSLYTDQVHGDKPISKEYEGTVVYSQSVGCCYCILASEAIGEMCFIMFRHFYLNNQPIDCRVATAMTASAGGSDRCPTIHRMLLSREIIDERDVAELVPLLHLNTSEIIIAQEEWDAIFDECEDYAAIMARVINNVPKKKQCLFIREDVIRAAALPGEKEKLPMLVSALRSKSISNRYNKVSQKVDNIVYSFLVRHGYYKQ